MTSSNREQRAEDPKSVVAASFYHYLVQNGLQKKSILLCGMEKSGNTWTRLVIINYFNILQNGATETLTFDELNAIQMHSVGYQVARNIVEETPDPKDIWGTVMPFRKGFPVFYKTHEPYLPHFHFFNKVIYLYRNPYDNLISNYYFWKKQKVPFFPWPAELREQIADINVFVPSLATFWARFYTLAIAPGEIKLNYEQMRHDPVKVFGALFQKLAFPYDQGALEKSVEFSSFANVKKMAEKSGQTYGNADPKSFQGNFLRSGKAGQYRDELRDETIEFTKGILLDNGVPLSVIESK